MKSGFVSIIGRSNVGKSTLLNSIVGEKISIISPKIQTTRNSIQGIYNDSDYQIIFVDTPGIHKAQSALGKRMDKIAFDSLKNNDLNILLIDSSKKILKEDEFIIKILRNTKIPLIICFNKIDLTNIELISDLKKQYSSFFPDAKMIEISALKKFNIDELIKLVKLYIPIGPLYYDVSKISNIDLKFRIEEEVRETIYYLFKEEIPYSVFVSCDEYALEQNSKNIFCKIIVEKDSQKGILIGKNGKMIKKIGILSRKKIEDFLGYNINLELLVKVENNWKNNEKILNKAGY